MKIREIKEKALMRLGECFPQTMIVMLLYLSTYMGVVVAQTIALTVALGGNITEEKIQSELVTVTVILLITMLVKFLVISPLNIGTTWWLIHSSRGEKNNVGYIFICFKNIKIYIKSILLRAVISLTKLALSAPLMICIYLGGVLHNTAFEDIDNSATYIILGVCSTLILLFMLAFYVWITLGFELCNPLFSLNPDKKISEIISSSITAVKNNRVRLVKLLLSFSGWAVSLIFVVPLFFVIPYFAMSYAVMLNDILTREIYLTGGTLGRNYVSYYNTLR